MHARQLIDDAFSPEAEVSFDWKEAKCADDWVARQGRRGYFVYTQGDPFGKDMIYLWAFNRKLTRDEENLQNLTLADFIDFEKA